MNIKSLFLDSLKIAILTASTGAAIRDIQSTINSRYPWPKNPNKYFSTRYTSQRGYYKNIKYAIHLALILLL